MLKIVFRMAVNARVQIWQNQIYRLHFNSSLILYYPCWEPPGTLTEIFETITAIKNNNNMLMPPDKQLLYVKLMFQLNYVPPSANIAHLNNAIAEIL